MSTEKTTNTTTFSERVLGLRQRLKMTQEQFSQHLRLNRSYLSEIENGLEPSDKVKERVELLEKSLVGTNTPHGTLKLRLGEMIEGPTDSRSGDVQEFSPEYGMVKKIIKIAEEGTFEQKALVNSFLQSVVEQIEGPRGDPQFGGGKN